MKRKLIKFSNYSFCITLPKKAVEQLGWGKGEEVDVDFDSKTRRIVVGKTKPTKAGPSKSSTTTTSSDKKESGDIQPIPKLRW